MYTMLVGKYFQVFRIELLFIYSPSSVSNHHQLPSPHIIYTLFKEWRLSSLITIIFCSTSTCRHKNASAFSSLLFLRRYFTCTNYIARGGWVVGGEREEAKLVYTHFSYIISSGRLQQHHIVWELDVGLHGSCRTARRSSIPILAVLRLLPLLVLLLGRF